MWRSENEMLDVVRRRAGVVRGRRRALATGVAAAVVLVCAAGVAFARLPGDGAGDARVRVAAAGGSPTSVSAVGPPVLPIPTTNPPETTVPAPTTAPAAIRSTTVPTVPTAPAVTEAPTTVPAPTAGGQPEPCSPDDVATTAAADKATYVPGQPVRIVGTLRNASGRACGAPSLTQTIAVADGSGKKVWGLGLSSHADCFEPGTCTWPPLTDESVSGCWDQLDGANGATVPLGTYTVRVSWTGPVTISASTTFQIVPDPAAPTTTVPVNRC